jgi:hypothetical protein
LTAPAALSPFTESIRTDTLNGKDNAGSESHAIPIRHVFGLLRRLNRQRAVIVAMVSVPEVQPPIVETIGMIAMGNDLMAAASVTATALRRGTCGGIGRADLDGALIVMTVVARMQMTVVNIVRMVAVANRQMATVCAVVMRMTRMSWMIHRFSLIDLNDVCAPDRILDADVTKSSPLSPCGPSVDLRIFSRRFK